MLVSGIMTYVARIYIDQEITYDDLGNLKYYTLKTFLICLLICFIVGGCNYIQPNYSNGTCGLRDYACDMYQD